MVKTIFYDNFKTCFGYPPYFSCEFSNIESRLFLIDNRRAAK